MATRRTSKPSFSILGQISEGIRSYVSAEAFDLTEPLHDVAVRHNSTVWDKEIKTVYAIVFDLDTATLQAAYYTPSYTNAYNDIPSPLSSHGFDWQQGSVYFGNEKVNAVTCVVAVIDLTNAYPWFAASVRDIRMLRIEEQNNLLPAIEQALATQQTTPQ